MPNEQINEMWDIDSMEYYSAIKKNEILINATTRMNFENMLKESAQSQK